MDRTTDSIEKHVEDEREALRSNLEELQDRVRSTLDWRRQFRSSTGAFLGFALGGGVLIGLATARRKAVPEELTDTQTPAGGPTARYTDHRRREVSVAWQSIESALIGVAAAKLKDTLANLLPGFRGQLARGEGSYPRDGSTRYRSW